MCKDKSDMAFQPFLSSLCSIPNLNTLTNTLQFPAICSAAYWELGHQKGNHLWIFLNRTRYLILFPPIWPRWCPTLTLTCRLSVKCSASGKELTSLFKDNNRSPLNYFFSIGKISLLLLAMPHISCFPEFSPFHFLSSGHYLVFDLLEISKQRWTWGQWYLLIDSELKSSDLWLRLETRWACRVSFITLLLPYLETTGDGKTRLWSQIQLESILALSLACSMIFRSYLISLNLSEFSLIKWENLWGS